MVSSAEFDCLLQYARGNALIDLLKQGFSRYSIHEQQSSNDVKFRSFIVHKLWKKANHSNLFIIFKFSLIRPLRPHQKFWKIPKFQMFKLR